MQVTRLTSENLPLFKDRVAKLAPDTPRRFGELSPAGMMRHLRTIIEMSLEEIPAVDRSTFFSRNIMRVIAFHVLPTWPKGKIKAPAEFTPDAGEFEQERQKLFAAFDRFADALRRDPERSTLHPLFGRHPLRYWARLHGRHFEHHFEQFGI